MIAGAHPQRGDGSGREERDHPWHGSGGPLGELDLLTSETVFTNGVARTR
jgi:hypothetical protein